MNAFGEALNLVFMRGSGDFSSGSMPMDSISDCIPMSSSPYSSAYGLNLRLHSHEFLSPCQWISGCLSSSSYSPAYGLKTQTAFPWVQVPIPQPMNLWMLEFKFLFPANESQIAFPWVQVPIPCQWTQSLEAFPWVQVPLPNFGVFWLGTTHVLPSWFKTCP